MFLIYIDESGKPDYSHLEPDYVLSAFIINEIDWQEMDNRIKMLKIRHFPKLSDESIELHASDILHHRNFFRNLTWDQIYQLLYDCFHEISLSHCTLLSIIIKKDQIRFKKKIDPEEWAYRLLFERICMYLSKKNQELTVSGQSSENAILLIDSVNHKYDKLLRNKILNFLRNGTYYQKNQFLIEDPLFISSQYRNMSQIVDLVAFCSRKKYRIESPSRMNQEFLKFFQMIEDRFDKDNQNRIYGCGIKIFP